MSEVQIVNERVSGLSSRVEKLENDRSELTKLSTLMEIQIEMNKKQDDFQREQSLTLVKMNENLTSLNQVTHKLDSRVGELEDSLMQNKIEDLTRVTEHEKSNSINVPQLFKNIMVTAITTIVLGIVFYLVKNYGAM